MEISRRFFLGGAISLAAAVTFKPSIAMMANIPTIYGDGKQDDSGGLSALFANEPVTFNKEQIGVESHKGITFHSGLFKINRTVNIPKNSIIKFDKKEHLEFIADNELELPFFICFDNIGEQFSGNIFRIDENKLGPLISNMSIKLYEHEVYF